MNKKSAGRQSQFRLKPAYAAVLLAFSVQTAQANPQGGSVVSGSASFAASGHTLTVTNTPGTIINWQGFSIGSNEITQFAQQSASSTVLNRVVGADPSNILGTLRSNGRVFLINPNGILFGAGSVVDVAGLTASTLNLSNADFLAGKNHFTKVSGAGNINNAGSITAQDNGQIYLIAPNVENTGVITAPNGEILLAAGASVDLVNTNDPNLRVNITAPAGDVTNIGKLIASSGSLGLFGTVVSNSGVANADSAMMQGGKIVFRASQLVDAGGTVTANGTSGGSVDISAAHSADPNAPGVVIQTGSIQAQGSSGTGGSVNMNADSILSAAAINVDGTTAGGEINVQAGGRAISTESAQYTANSTQGRGGDILVSADVSNYTSGSYSATGDTGGNLTLAGNEIKLAGAQLDASGTSGGGNIHVGGLMHGAAGFGAQGITLANASTVIANSATVFKADALQTGNGGEVVLWSDQAMSFGGSISAKGGAVSGDGGMSEVSGLTSLDYAGLTDLSATNGLNGTLLLDPNNITIVSGSTAGVPTASVMNFVDPTPGAGNSFGSNVTELPNGNIVVTSPYDDFAALDAGAVYLYSPAGSLLSTLVGSTIGDNVGNNGITALSNGNYVVSSSYWNNGAVQAAGAVTWGSFSTGISGTVNPSNSLVGGTAFDQVGSYGITALSNGNYVVNSPYWDNLTVVDAGAVTWGNGSGGTVGTVSSSNSLVGSTASDSVGSYGITALSNGNYLVRSAYWDNGAVVNAGAVTWGDGSTAGTRLVGAVSAANSLVGSTTGDQVGTGGIIELSNGNYVVTSYSWNTYMGAVTWGSGTSGVSGAISASNSLVGSTAYDQIGNYGITEVGSGNYVVDSPYWNTYMGAVTWVNGLTGQVSDYASNSSQNIISAANSLVGSTASDYVGYNGVTVLNNGNYVVTSSQWNTYMGAVTWGSGATGVSGAISAANSLVGSASYDNVGSQGVTALSNGNYVVDSAYWSDAGVTSAGAVTWVDGATGQVSDYVANSNQNIISAANSLVGSTANDNVGFNGVTALSNGNYAVSSGSWDNGAVVDAGAVTWGNGSVGTVGAVTTANSLVGSTASDNVGSNGVTALIGNGNYVVSSSNWDNGSAVDAGAVTWGNGTTGTTGIVSAANSLAGSASYDQIGSNGITALSNGNYVVDSPDWNSGAAVHAGAVTWGSGTTGVAGVVSAANSLVGSTAYDRVGSDGIDVLSNGNYVVGSSHWDNGTAWDAGAVTWGNGTTGVKGVVSVANSLVGSTAYDNVGSNGITELGNSNFVVVSYGWDNGTIVDAGAATWCNGTGGTVGAITSFNSLTGKVTDGPATVVALNVSANIGNAMIAVPAFGYAGLAGAGRVFILGAPVAGMPASGTLFGDTPGSDITLGVGNIVATLNTGTNVVLQANNDITQSLGAKIVATGDSSLTLQAGHSVTLNDVIDINIGVLTITANDPGALSAGGGVIDTSLATLTAGVVNMTNYGGDIKAGAITSRLFDLSLANNNFSINLNAANNINVTGALSNATGGDAVLRADMNGTGSGTINFSGSGSINLTGGRADLYYNPVSYTDSATRSDSFFNPYTSYLGSTQYTAWMLVNDVGLETGGTSGLQAINTNLAGNYALGRDIDATTTSTWNLGAGFVPIGTFTGNFDGMGHTISNLTINASSSRTGLFGEVGVTGVVKNVGLINNIMAVSGSTVGGLVGYNAGTIFNSYVSNGTVNVTGAYSNVGGLVGSNVGTISNSYVSGGSVTGSYSAVGGLAGSNSGSGNIIDSHVINVSVVNAATWSASVGGLVGNNSATISNSYVSGGSVTGVNSKAGGLVGVNSALGIISNDYVSNVSVLGNNSVGGLVGSNNFGGTISDSYANGGTVSGSSSVGGLVGYNAGVLTNSYASNGSITSVGTTVGGVVGWNEAYGGGVVTNTYWDSSNVGASLFGIGYDPSFLGSTNVNAADVAGVALSSASYTGFDFTSGTGNWFMIDGSTRPFLQMEYSTNITNAHQLQLIAMNTGANYTLGADIDMAETATGTGMWGSAGFVPLYLDGKLDGQGHTVNNLFINLPSAYQVGLFSYLDYGAVVNDIGLVGGSVSGYASVGGLVGYNNNGTISNSYVSGGSVTGNYDVGGLVGQNGYSGSIINSHVINSQVTGNSGVGGLAGYNNNIIGNSYVSNSSVTGSSNVGGLAGYNYNQISNSYVSGGSVTGNYDVGGLVGYNNGIIHNSQVSAGSVSGLTRVGGLVGQNYFGTIDHSYVDTGTVVNGGNYVGGLLGYDSGEGVITGNIITDTTVNGDSYVGGMAGMLDRPTFTSTGYADNNQVITSFVNGGVVTGGSYVGGLVGWNGITITNGSVSGTIVNGISDVGGLVGRNAGTSTYNYSISVGRIGYSFVSGGTVTGSSNVGGLVGYNAAGTTVDGGTAGGGGFGGSISNSYVSGGTVTSTAAGYVYAGGLVGSNVGILNNSYVDGGTVKAASGSGVGGLAGYNSGNIDASYVNNGSITGGQSVGGLVGGNLGNISNSYVNSGNVSGNRFLGGFVGYEAVTIVNSHFNVDAVTINGVNTVTEFGLYGTQYSDWYNSGALTPLNIANYTASLPSSGGSYTISDVQGMKDMLGFADAGYTFTLASSVTLPAGYNVPNFSGTFDGGGNTLSGLDVNLPNYDIGLFDYVAAGSTISNLSLLNPVVSGYSEVGALVGYNEGAIFNSSSSGGTVNGTSDYAGGLVGYNVGTIDSSHVSGGSVAGTSFIGGLVGLNSAGSGVQGGYVSSGTGVDGGVGNAATISNSYVSGGTVNGDSFVGGLVGQNISGNGGNGGGAYSGVGGAGGAGGAATISGSFVSGGTVNGNSYVGGLVGQNVAGSGGAGGYAYYGVGGAGGAGGAATISGSFVSGVTTTANTGNVGGLAGSNQSGVTGYSGVGYYTGGVGGAGGTAGAAAITISYASGGTVTSNLASGSANAGGLVGTNLGSISSSYASTGNVSSAGGSNVGGLVGYNDSYGGAVVSNNFWNTTTAGATFGVGYDTTVFSSTDIAGGVTGMIDADMKTMANFNSATLANGNINPGWDIANTGGAGSVWRIYDGYTAPLLTSFLTQATVAANNDTVTYSRVGYSGGNGVTASGAALYGGSLLGTPVYGGTSLGAVNVLAGGYSISASGIYSDQLGYDILGYTNGTLTINPLAVTLTAPSVTRTYDGGTTYTTLAGDLAALSGSLLGGDTVTAATIDYTNKNAGAGNKTVTFSGVTISDGNGGNNYAVTLSGNSTSTINPLAVTLTAPSVTRTYNGGTTYTTLAGDLAALSGSLLGGDTVTAATIDYTDKNAGTGNKTVTFSAVTISDGNGGNNYTVTFSGNSTSTITPASLTVTADYISKLQNTSDPLLTYMVSGLLPADSGTYPLPYPLIGALSRDPGEAVGAYQINQGTLALTSTNLISTNYTMTYVGATFSILAPISDFSVFLTGLEPPVDKKNKPKPDNNLIVLDTTNSNPDLQSLPMCGP